MEVLQLLVAETGSALVVDLCSGSGNMGWRWPSVCPVAGSLVAISRKRRFDWPSATPSFWGLQVAPATGLGTFWRLFETEEFLGAVDLLTCNPPYISTARVETMAHENVDFEPWAAFDGGPLGIKLLARLVKEAPRFVSPGGWVTCETGLGQGESMSRMFQKSPDYQAGSKLQRHRGPCARHRGPGVCPLI